MSGQGYAVMGTAVATGSNRAIDAANRAINSPLLEDNCINGAQGILINVTGSNTLSLQEVHEASSIIQKAAHENANIIFGAVMDEAMKESVKITVIAAGFREVAGKKTHTRPSYLPKTWKATRTVTRASHLPQPQQTNVVQQVSRNVSEVVHQVARNVSQVHEVPADDLDVPTFLRRQAQKAYSAILLKMGCRLVQRQPGSLFAGYRIACSFVRLDISENIFPAVRVKIPNK